MLYGRLLHIVVCVMLIQPNFTHNVKLNHNKSVYSTSLATPRNNFILNLFNKLIYVSRESYLRAKRELFVEDVNKRLNKQQVKLFVILEQSELFKRCNNVHYNEDGSEVNFADNDKVLLPPSFFEYCKAGNYNVPFQLLIHKVHVPEPYHASKPPENLLPTDPSRFKNLSSNSSDSLMQSRRKEPGNLDDCPNTVEQFVPTEDVSKECISCSAIEFRTDENYVYVPKWIMDNLNLKPFDVVMVELVKLDDCTGVELQCLEKQFYEDVKDVKRALEERLKYYSTLTLNAVIPITIGERRFRFKVAGLETAAARRAPFASIQDIDLNVKLL